MAEPVGITGTAVGIVSLGLQLYTGISDYLDAVKGRDEDLRHAREHAKTLQVSLRAVNDAIKKTKHDSAAAKDAVKRCKKSCETELKALEALLKDLQGAVVVPTDRLAQAKNSLSKWSYPFNKRDIAKLENRLGSTNGVLQTALLTLQMSISNITADAVSGLQQAVETIQITVANNNRTAVAQSEALTRVSETSTQVSQKVQFISQEALVRQDARLEEICTYLQAATGPDRQISQLVVSQQDLRKVCDTMLDLLRQPKPESRVLGTQVTSFQSSGNAVTQLFCRCKIRRNLRRNRNRWGPLFFETELERTDRHAPECPMSGVTPAMHQKKRTFGVSIPAMAKILNSAIRISWSLASGGSSCSQSIAWVATVDDESSPSFGIVRIATEAAFCPFALTTQEMQVLVESCRRRLMLCYANKQASLTDVNDSGESVLGWLACMGRDSHARNIDNENNLAQVFRLLAAFNIPTTGANLPFLASVSESRWLTNIETASETLAALLTCCSEPAGNDHKSFNSVHISGFQLTSLRYFPVIAENLGFNPLSIAILREDEEEVQALVEKYPSYRMEDNYCGQLPVHIAIQLGNFRILSLVIKGATVDSVNTPDNNHLYPIDLALYSSYHPPNPSRSVRRQACIGCKMLELLLASKSVLFQGIVRLALVTILCEGAKKMIIRHLAMRRKELEQLAVSSLSSAEVQRLGLCGGRVLDQNAAKVQRYLEARSYHIPKHLMVYDEKHNTNPSENEQSIYAYINDKELAEYSISMGFDTETAFVDLFRRIALRAIDSYVPGSWLLDYSRVTSYVSWMIERGADIASGAPVDLVPGVSQKTTWVHYLMAYLGREKREAIFPNGRLPQPVTNVAFSEAVVDECRCQCSSQGCTPLIKFLGGLVGGVFYVQGRDKIRTLEQCAPLLPGLLENLMPPREYHNIGYRWIYRAILRALTFDALSLRHTCCGLWERPIPDAEEIEEILQEDSARLQLLEDLVAEFETGCGSNTNLGPFIRDTWFPRMREVITELASRKLTEEELKEAEECGVEWEHCGSEVPLSSRVTEAVTLGPFDLEFWMRKLDEIAIDPQRPLNVG